MYAADFFPRFLENELSKLEYERIAEYTYQKTNYGSLNALFPI